MHVHCTGWVCTENWSSSIQERADADPAFHSEADPDPTRHFDTNPDLTFQFDGNPDPTFYKMKIRIRPFILLRIRILVKVMPPDPQDCSLLTVRPSFYYLCSVFCKNNLLVNAGI
jgi:hypothetical protein